MLRCSPRHLAAGCRKLARNPNFISQLKATILAGHGSYLEKLTIVIKARLEMESGEMRADNM